MNNNSHRPSFNVGTSSILFIFVILTLVSFAVLSLASSVSDYRLSENVSVNTKNYYIACNEIEDKLSQTDLALKKLYDSDISRKGYFDEAGHTISFAEPVSDIQTLIVEISILYPEEKGDPFYKITSWEVVTTGSLEYDDSLDLFK